MERVEGIRGASSRSLNIPDRALNSSANPTSMQLGAKMGGQAAPDYSTIRVMTGSAAAEIVDRLKAHGYQAYLVGGCVRDLLLGLEPRDFDVATGARPEEVVSLFPNARLVGAHFGVVLVTSGSEDVEVATFRSDHAYLDGRRPTAIEFETDPRRTSSAATSRSTAC